MSPIEVSDPIYLPDSWGDSQFDLYEDANGTRRFSNGNLQRYIDEAISRKKPGSDIIAIAHAETGGDKEAYVSLAVKLNDEWSIAAAAYKRFDGSRDWGAGAEVVWEK